MKFEEFFDENRTAILEYIKISTTGLTALDTESRAAYKKHLTATAKACGRMYVDMDDDAKKMLGGAVVATRNLGVLFRSAKGDMQTFCRQMGVVMDVTCVRVLEACAKHQALMKEEREKAEYADARGFARDASGGGREMERELDNMLRAGENRVLSIESAMEGSSGKSRNFDPAKRARQLAAKQSLALAKGDDAVFGKGPPFVCSECGGSFGKLSAIKTHAETHLVVANTIKRAGDLDKRIKALETAATASGLKLAVRVPGQSGRAPGQGHSRDADGDDDEWLEQAPQGDSSGAPPAAGEAMDGDGVPSGPARGGPAGAGVPTVKWWEQDSAGMELWEADAWPPARDVWDIAMINRCVCARAARLPVAAANTLGRLRCRGGAHGAGVAAPAAAVAAQDAPDAFSGVSVPSSWRAYSAGTQKQRAPRASDHEPSFTELLDAMNTDSEAAGSLSKEVQANLARNIAEGAPPRGSWGVLLVQLAVPACCVTQLEAAKSSPWSGWCARCVKSWMTRRSRRPPIFAKASRCARPGGIMPVLSSAGIRRALPRAQSARLPQYVIEWISVRYGVKKLVKRICLDLQASGNNFRAYSMEVNSGLWCSRAAELS